jgi:glutaredoxin
MSDDVTGQDDQAPSTAVEFYWRPGCPFCSMLERNLAQVDLPLAKRNIWDDPEAAAFVRSVADGNETVPTVVVAGRAMVNPPAELVTEVVAEFAPHLLTNG